MSETQTEAIRRIMSKKFYLAGKTYEYRDSLKKLGWKWEPYETGGGRWIYEGLETDQAVKLVQELGGVFLGVVKW